MVWVEVLCFAEAKCGICALWKLKLEEGKVLVLSVGCRELSGEGCSVLMLFPSSFRSVMFGRAALGYIFGAGVKDSEVPWRSFDLQRCRYVELVMK